MKILMIPNRLDDWSAHNRAKNLVKYLPNIESKIIRMYQIPSHELDAVLSEGWDIVHLHTSGSYKSMYLPIFQKHKIPLIYSIVSHRSMAEMSAEEKKAWFDLSTKIVVLNKFLYDEFQPQYPNKVVYIPNGVDTQVFKPQLTAGFIGQRSDYKGFPMIQQACHEMGITLIHDPANFPDGVLPPEALVKDYYSKMDFYICASEGEGSHNPTMEALSMGIPVITTNVGIAQQLKNQGAEIIIIERSVEGIKKGINEWQDKYLKSRLLMQTKYDWKIIALKYIKLYEKILGGKK